MTSFKTINILLKTNIRNNTNILYNPSMTIPTTRQKIIYFTPTIPIDLTDIKTLDPKYNENLRNKLENQTTVNKSQLKFQDLKSNDIVSIFLNPNELLTIVQNKIKQGNKSGNPVAPRQFKNASDLLYGEVMKLNNKIILKQDKKYFELNKPEPDFSQFTKEFKIQKVSASSFNVGSKIIVTNGEKTNSPLFRQLTFNNSVEPLTIQQADSKGYIDKNIRFIVDLLFNTKQKFYFNGNPNIAFPIHSYKIQESSNKKLWEIGSSDPNTFNVKVELMLMPILSVSKRKNQLTSNKTAMDCVYRKEEIMKNFHTLFGSTSDFKISKDLMVDIPENLRTNTSTNQMREIRQPQNNKVALRPRTVGGRKKYKVNKTMRNKKK
jgi:hypothetical protein